MAITKLLVELIISVVILLLIINFIFPDLLSGLFSGNEMSGMPVVQLNVDPEDIVVLPVSSSDVTRQYTYSVEIFNAQVEYTGDMKVADRHVDSIMIVPVIDFKGSSKKASFEGSGSFTVTEDDRSFEDAVFKVELTSSLPSIFIGSNPFDGYIKKGDSYLINSIPNNKGLILRLLDVSSYSLPIWGIGGWIYKTSCTANFAIECDRVITFKLKDDCDEDLSDCERRLKACNGEIYIRSDDNNCGNRNSKIYMSFVDYGQGMDYEIGDELGVSFWIKTCADKEEDYDSLWATCGDEYFLGRYKFLVNTSS